MLIAVVAIMAIVVLGAAGVFVVVRGDGGDVAGDRRATSTGPVPGPSTTTEPIPGDPPDPMPKLKPGTSLIPPGSVERHEVHSDEAGISFSSIDEYGTDYDARVCVGNVAWCSGHGYIWEAHRDQGEADPWPGYSEKVYLMVHPGATEQDGIKGTAGSSMYEGESHPIVVDGHAGTRRVIVDYLGYQRVWNMAFIPTRRGLLVVAVMVLRYEGVTVPPLEPLLSTVRIAE